MASAQLQTILNALRMNQPPNVISSLARSYNGTNQAWTNAQQAATGANGYTLYVLNGRGSLPIFAGTMPAIGQSFGGQVATFFDIAEMFEKLAKSISINGNVSVGSGFSPLAYFGFGPPNQPPLFLVGPGAN